MDGEDWAGNSGVSGPRTHLPQPVVATPRPMNRRLGVMGSRTPSTSSSTVIRTLSGQIWSFRTTRREALTDLILLPYTSEVWSMWWIESEADALLGKLVLYDWLKCGKCFFVLPGNLCFSHRELVSSSCRKALQSKLEGISVHIAQKV